jgi:hypothetical protein
MTLPLIIHSAQQNVFKKMYVANVKNRLRQLNTPQENDMKRWPYELIQNAKDRISFDSTKTTINITIEATVKYVKFQHDGALFTANALLALLYKYSDGKENAESVGRFGTGFLTTHCLSREVSISGDMFTDE